MVAGRLFEISMLRGQLVLFSIFFILDIYVNLIVPRKLTLVLVKDASNFQVVEKYSKFDITSPPMGMSVSNAGNGSRSSAMRKLLVEGPWRLKESSKGKVNVLL